MKNKGRKKAIFELVSNISPVPTLQTIHSNAHIIYVDSNTSCKWKRIYIYIYIYIYISKRTL